VRGLAQKIKISHKKRGISKGSDSYRYFERIFPLPKLDAILEIAHEASRLRAGYFSFVCALAPTLIIFPICVDRSPVKGRFTDSTPDNNYAADR